MDIDVGELKQKISKGAVGMAPSDDGQLTCFIAAGAGGTGTPPLVYVNGMNTNGQTHRETALFLSALAKRPVWGLYNKTDGGGKDFLQCIGDKLRFNPLKAPLRAINNKRHGRADTAEDEIDGNPATLALYRLLRSPRFGNARIVCHSQGNLITSGATRAVAYAGGRGSIQGFKVFGLASPTAFWPKGLNVRTYTFADDFVTWLSGGRSYIKKADVSISGRRTMLGLFDHDVFNYIAHTEFYQDLARDLGI
jgi:hypothetical protein